MDASILKLGTRIKVYYRGQIHIGKITKIKTHDQFGNRLRFEIVSSRTKAPFWVYPDMDWKVIKKGQK